MIFTPVYTALLGGLSRSPRPRIVSSCGGTRSGKTISALQLLWLIASQDTTPTITSVVSETFPHLKRGAIRDYRTALGDQFDEGCWSVSDSTYTFPGSGAIIEFFSADNAAKVHGPARDRLFLNEVQNIDYDTARQLFVRTREFILMDYNPTHEFWAQTKVEPREDCVTIHSTYLDNRDRDTGAMLLTDAQIREIEANKADAAWWQVYGLGKTGTLEGVVYKNWDLVDAMPPKGRDKAQKDNTPDELYADALTEIQGMDFGFTNDPTARVQVYVDSKRKEAWVRERCYRTQMRNGDIADDLKADGVTRRVPIYADCAEPKSIREIGDEGFHVIPCDKDAPVRSDKLAFQLQWMQGWRLHFTKDSTDLIHEARNYTWAKDRDGNAQNYPIDKYNHLLDALRYALWTHYGAKAGRGIYHVSI